MKKISVAVAILAGSFVPACMWSRFPGPVDNAPSDSVHVVKNEAGVACLKVALYQPLEEDAVMILEAFAAACESIYEIQFNQRLAGEYLELREFESSNIVRVHGADTTQLTERIRQDLRSGKPVHIFSKNRWHNENAIASAKPRRISIQSDWLARWQSEDPHQRALVIDTLAHELTHLLRCSKKKREKNCFQVILDTGRSSDCRTFSYRFGQIAADLYLEREFGRAN